MINPDMPTQELLLHMGEMTASEIRAARSAIRWANNAAKDDLDKRCYNNLKRDTVIERLKNKIKMLMERSDAGN